MQLIFYLEILLAYMYSGTITIYSLYVIYNGFNCFNIERSEMSQYLQYLISQSQGNEHCLKHICMGILKLGLLL